MYDVKAPSLKQERKEKEKGIKGTLLRLAKKQELWVWGLLAEIWALTRALFVNLVQAFDTAQRKALFAILRCFGSSDHFVNIVIRLNESALINVKIGEDNSELESSIGDRQGSCEVPILFLTITQAAMGTLTWEVANPDFRARSKGVTMGERQVKSSSNTPFMQRTRRAHKERGWYVPHNTSLASCPSGCRSG